MSSKEKFVRGFLPSVTWAVFIGTTYAALGRHHVAAAVASAIAAIVVTLLAFSERQAADKNRISLSLVGMGVVALMLIIGINIGGATPAIGLGIWFLYGFAGFTILQFSKNS